MKHSESTLIRSGRAINRNNYLGTLTPQQPWYVAKGEEVYLEEWESKLNSWEKEPSRYIRGMKYNGHLFECWGENIKGWEWLWIDGD